MDRMTGLSGAMGQMGIDALPPPPAVSAWGTGPPAAIKTAAMAVGGPAGVYQDPPLPGSGALWDPPLPQQHQPLRSALRQDMGSMGDMFDPMGGGGGGFGAMDHISSVGDFLDPMSAQAVGADSSSGPSLWDFGGGGGASSSSANMWEPQGSNVADSSTVVMAPFHVLESMLQLPDDEDEEMCTICFDELANACLKPCGHKFCSDCVKQLKKRAVFLATEGVMCPHCRGPVKEFVLPKAVELFEKIAPKSAWGTTGSSTPAPAPIPQTRAPAPAPRAPAQKQQSTRQAAQSNGQSAAPTPKNASRQIPASTPTPTPATAPAPSLPSAPAQAPAPIRAPTPPRSQPADAFSSFAAGGSGSDEPWNRAGDSLEMPIPGGGTGIGGFGIGSSAGWGGSSFGGLPGLNTDLSVFGGGGQGLWGGTGSGGPTDSWSSQAGLPAFEGGYEAFQMPGSAGGGGGFGGVGFGSFGTGSSGERGGFGSAAGGSRGGSIEIKVKFAGEQDKDLTIYANQDDDGKWP